ncbi:MAG: DUF308 domain-containing protein [Caldilineales bacterium]|nr:DUF308 domain-containing protein [Caldilineales bacterium]
MSANAMQAQAKQLPWWLVLVDGILAIIIGILLFTQPAATAGTLVLFLGIYWLIKGIVILIGLFRDRSAWGWKLFIGIISILAGVAIIGAKFLVATIFVSVAFAWVIGIWGIVIGILEIIQAFRGEGWGVGVLGVISIIFGYFIIANPFASAVALWWVFAIFAIVGGIFAMVKAFQMR